jgi:tetratricopeptide (TPR) repeat protein
MKEPTSPEELERLHQILRADPRRFITITSRWIQKNPNNARALFSRHFGWMAVGEPQRALSDLDKVAGLQPDMMTYLSRGQVHRHLGAYEKALGDFDLGEAIDPQEWEDHAVGLLYQADCHARLGNEAAALNCCARLPENFWTPGLQGASAGGKSDIAEEVRRIAASARRKNLGPT